MVKFLLYLFESGLCLSILFMVYLFFFRKETYFRFNRWYLVFTMLLSLSIPFVHLNLNISDTQKFENTFYKIGEFRNYYEQLIAMTDPEYLQNHKKFSNSGFEDFDLGSTANSLQRNNDISGLGIETKQDEINLYKSTKRLSIAKLSLIIYVLGALFFIFRILVLFQWIYKTIFTNPITHVNGIRVINVKENLPPFSFLGYVFVNNKIMDESELEQILTHEKVHIKQFHTIDLLLSHFVSIIHWYNPLIWLLHKTIKTNHEFITDNKVVKEGFDLLNYQELLLNQFVSIPSVQLVNNFNLISIKKRIAMMNKIKSGFLAKLKALLIIPTSIIVFFLFANLTVYGPGKAFNNFSIFNSQNNVNLVKGLWINDANNGYGLMVQFNSTKFSVLEDDITLKEYPYQLKDNQIVLGLPNKNTIELNYELIDNQIKIWWSEAEFSVYNKSKFNNSVDEYLSGINEPINLPVIENYWIITRPELCINVALVNDKIFVNRQLIDYSDLKEALLKEKATINQLDANLISIKLYADKDLSMKYMHSLNLILREIGLLKVIHMGKVTDEKVSKLQRNYIGMAKRLPPKDGLDIITTEELEEKGIAFFEIDATNSENTPDLLKPKFKELLENSEKYVAGLYYDNKTIFNTYIGYQDMARTVVYEFRNNYALKNYNLSYDDLSP
ncbi:MAG: M56 family metallopeptidase, partial [Bacteroidales bacterium]|nr:M56 family metallopeptidase [Bacteroidales bacterium]